MSSINNKNFLIPVANELIDHSKLVLKGAGLGLLKPKFFSINEARASEEQSEENNYDKLSAFGLPVFDVITLNQLSYVDFTGTTVNLGNFTLDIALVDVSNERNIIKTPITGRNGTVKEYMSDGDYEVKINGSLVNNLANVPPEILVRALNSFCKSQIEIKINSTVLSYLDIFSIVIVRSRFTQRMGTRNVIDYELDCLSETPFELKA